MDPKELLLLIGYGAVMSLLTEAICFFRDRRLKYQEARFQAKDE